MSRLPFAVPVFHTQFTYMPELFEPVKHAPPLPVCEQNRRALELGILMGMPVTSIGTLYSRVCPECAKRHIYSEATHALMALAKRLDIFKDDWPEVKTVLKRHQGLCMQDEAFMLGLVQSARTPDIQAETLPELDWEVSL